jgi:organic hydroperoxide reductase OsmC/OhrA
MKREHTYRTHLTWTGNTGSGTTAYNSYQRSHTLSVENKQDILCSSDATFRGDKTKFNPEELFLASLSACHMLWYLHCCADNGITVVDYNDNAIGTMMESENDGGHFTEVTLHPLVTILEKNLIEKANSLHKDANKKCFISNSCNFPVMHKPICIVREK